MYSILFCHIEPVECTQASKYCQTDPDESPLVSSVETQTDIRPPSDGNLVSDDELESVGVLDER
jgi:hypothetical protein